METVYEFHPYCTLFPQAEESTLADIAADIKENGLNDPIVLYEGKILDGRNRYLACKQAKIEPVYVEYHGDEPLQFVVSKNLHRRHLSESQRAMVAQKIWSMTRESKSGLTQADVAKQFSVSPASVRVAAAIDELAIDEIKDQVVAGTMSLNKASSIVKKAEKMVEEDRKKPPKSASDQVKRVKEAQVKIYNDEDDDRKVAQEFNKAVLSGVYDGKRYRKDVQEIQETLVKIDALPGLYNDAIQLITTLEQEKMLINMVDIMVTTMKQAKTKFDNPAITYEEVVTVVKDMLNGLFILPETETSPNQELLDHLKEKFISDCDAVIKSASNLRKKIANKDNDPK